MRMQTSLPFVEVVSAGVDWITCTSTHENSLLSFQSLVDETLCSQRNQGNFIRPWAGLGYQGYKCGPFIAGSRNDGYLLLMSGEDANLVWQRFRSWATKVTRFDVQITVRTARGPHHEISRCLRGVNTANKKRGRPIQLKQIRDNNSGYSIQLGSRSSEECGRLYDKHAESGDKRYLRCVRAETELKRRRADFASRYFASFPVGTIPIVPFVSQWFENRGANLRLPGETLHLLMPQDVSGGQGVLTDVNRSLRWLENQVRPSVERLKAYGHLNEVLTALGLDNL